ncbi:MAG: hypothetical protein ABL900_19010 [Burkholderiaceae bacterium]
MLATAALASLLALAAPLAAHAEGRTVFVRSAVENGDGTVTLPLYRGTSKGQSVWYLLLDSSDGNDADRLGINRSQKLANARGTTAVQKVKIVNGVVDFPASVNFGLLRDVKPDPITGFPPLKAEPGARGDWGYSPLIEMPDGTIRNAPHVYNNTGKAAKVRGFNGMASVRYELTDGFANGKAVKYVSTDASAPDVAALENVTYAQALNAAPFAGGDGTNSARTTLVAFVNGQTGAGNPQRQGLNSALLDGLAPLNLLFWTPNQGRYSPLWDVFPAQWSAAAVNGGRNLRQTDRNELLNLVQDATVTGPEGARFGPGGFVVNCPIISSD